MFQILPKDSFFNNNYFLNCSSFEFWKRFQFLVILAYIFVAQRSDPFLARHGKIVVKIALKTRVFQNFCLLT